MFSQAKVVIESMYIDTCSIVEHTKVRKTDGSTGFDDVTVKEDIPCRLSFSSASTTNETDSGSNQVQQIKLFLQPDIDVKSGSKLVITHLGKDTEFKKSGVPKVYETHQEILLDIFKGWS